MKILFIGDSITRGDIGVSYVKMIRTKYANAQIVNAGYNGDTLNIIAKRLFKILKKNPAYDYIVLQAGYNDLLLPVLNAKGGLFRFGYERQIKRGTAPLLSATDFENFYINIIEEILRVSSSKIVLTTIGPINEWQDDPLNRKRLKYNDSIRRVAGYYKCLLADIAVACDNALAPASSDSYFLNSFWNVVFFDPFACMCPKGADRLSKKRKLSLTIDGIHLNTRGAAIFSDTISKLISV
jgi:lysophospholipase L1-like esterase